MVDAVEIAEDSFVTAGRLFAELAPTAIVDERDDVLHVHTGAGLATFNPTVVLDLPGDVAGLLDAASEFHRRHESPAWVIAVREPDVDAFAPAATAAGFDVAEEQPFMVLDSIPEADLPGGLTVRRASDLSDVRLHFELISRAFDMPIEAIEIIISEALVDERAPIFIGEVDGEPVTTSMLVVSDGAGVTAAGVYDVATLATHRGRGLGAAMTAHAADVGRRERGCEVATLQSSPMGLSVYESMGYRTVTRWQMWTK